MAPHDSRLLVISRNLVNVGNLLLLLAVVFLVAYRAANSHPPEPSSGSTRETSFSMAHASYEENVLEIRRSFLARFENVTYLDFATLPIFPDSAMNNFSDHLHTHLFGNTHSESPSAEMSTNTIESARLRVLKFLGTKLTKYSVIFTYSPGHALRTVMEAFPFTSSRTLFYSSSSHSDILGVRGFATEKQGKTSVFTIADDGVDSFDFREIPDNVTEEFNAVVFPLVDQFSGRVVSDGEIRSIFKKYGTTDNATNAIIADATLYLQAHALELETFPFHAVVFSFEKLFGFPNIAAIVVRNSLVKQLTRPYFGGGTVVYALTLSAFEKMRIVPNARFEDGSLPFLALAAVESGFQVWETLSHAAIGTQVGKLTRQLKERLAELKYADGTPGVRIYGDRQNGIVTFNILTASGEVYPYQKVVSAAADSNIYIIGGCHATPGSCDEALGIHPERQSGYGAVRVSLGWSTIEGDIDALLDCLRSAFVH